MTTRSDGYELNAHLRSSHPVPTTIMVDALAQIEADMRIAASGRPVSVEQWVQWIQKDRSRRDAAMRLLFLLIGVHNMSADDVATLRHQLQQTLKDRRRPVRPIRSTGPRESPQLW